MTYDIIERYGMQARFEELDGTPWRGGRANSRGPELHQG